MESKEDGYRQEYDNQQDSSRVHPIGVVRRL